MDDLLGAIGNAVEWVVDAVLGFPTWSVAAFDWVVDALEAVSAEAWVLVVLAVGLFWYVLATVRATGVLGSVKIADLQAQGDEEKQKVVLSADLRSALSSKGLVAPPVPSGPPTAAIAAVTASPVPQAGWLGKILEAVQTYLPRPREYDVGGTLRSRTRYAAERAGDQELVCGVTYTLSAAGRPPLNVIETVWQPTFPKAVEATAEAVYMRVSTSDERVFPRWAQWWKPAAIDEYVAGLTDEAEIVDADNSEVLDEGLGHFDTAHLQQPTNWLPALRAANLRETKAAASPASDRRERTAEALLSYLDIIEHAGTLAQAHYRASGLFASLDPGPRRDYPEPVASLLHVRLKLDSNAAQLEVSYELKWKALQESRKTRNLLRWWGVPVKARRLRNRFEPRGRDRRMFLKAVKISHRCIRNHIGWTLPWDPLAVRSVFFLRWNSAGWQAHYNAACFFALRKDWDRSIKHLRRSIDDPESRVTPYWLNVDPDLKRLKTRRPARWKEIADRA